MPKPSVTMLRALVWTLTIVLASTATVHTSTLWIRGRVLDPSGAPMPGATVRLTSGDQGFERIFETGEKGRFQFGELSQGNYRIIASSRGYRAADQSLSLPEDATNEVQLTLQMDPSLTIYERIMVVGDPERVDEIPGSAHIIGPMELKRQKQGLDDIHRMLRQIPGVNIQEEEGYGLRPNIGMRGTGVDRSSKITLMEDGVLIAPAPYAAPSAYYFPTSGRMRSLEVRKGSSQIKYGPRTNGGVLNLVSSEIPQALRLDGKLGFGSDSAGQGHLNLGGTHGKFGWLLESYQVENRWLQGTGWRRGHRIPYRRLFGQVSLSNTSGCQDLPAIRGEARFHRTGLGRNISGSDRRRLRHQPQPSLRSLSERPL